MYDVTSSTIDGAAIPQDNNNSDNICAEKSICKTNELHELFFTDEFKSLIYLLKPLPAIYDVNPESKTNDTVTL